MADDAGVIPTVTSPLLISAWNYEANKNTWICSRVELYFLLNNYTDIPYTHTQQTLAAYTSIHIPIHLQNIYRDIRTYILRVRERIGRGLYRKMKRSLKAIYPGRQVSISLSSFSIHSLCEKQYESPCLPV